MSYEDRLIKPAYTSPVTGTRTSWKYREAFTSEFQKRLDSRRYVGLDGVYHVDLGVNGRDYPMSCVFDGEDHDIDAKNFVQTLLESTKDSPGYLEHPVEGVIAVVVASGRVVQDPVNDGAETIVEVLFQDQTFPPEIEQDSPTISTEKQFDALSASASSDFDALSFLDTANGKLAAVKAATANLDKISQTVSRASRGVAGLTTSINQITDDVLRNLDTLVKAPAILGDQLQALVGTVAAIPGAFADKINAWGDLYSSSRSPSGDTITPTNENRNYIANQELTCTSCVGNTLRTVAGNATSFSSPLEALNSLAEAQFLRADLEEFLSEQQAVYDDNVFQEQYVAQNETLDQIVFLSQLVANAVRDAIPGLGASISVVLDRDYALLQFAADYFGSVEDNVLNRIIDTNNLSFDEIILLPKGREVLI